MHFEGENEREQNDESFVVYVLIIDPSKKTF